MAYPPFQHLLTILQSIRPQPRYNQNRDASVVTHIGGWKAGVATSLRQMAGSADTVWIELWDLRQAFVWGFAVAVAAAAVANSVVSWLRSYTSHGPL